MYTYRGIPLVTTPFGADGLLFDQKTSSKVAPFATADSAVMFVKQVVMMFLNASLWTATSSAALSHVYEHFSLAAHAHDIERALNIAFENHEVTEKTGYRK